jgi:hypothetical protein
LFSEDEGEFAGAGKIQIFPSVRTPSTSKMMSLILRARAVADGLGIARILALSEDKPVVQRVQ